MSERRSEGDPGFGRVAIVNRGEAAVRLIRAVRELNLEHGCCIRTIALHTEAERRAVFVREADEALIVGGQRPYLDHGELERALRASGADAAWVGWGFVADDPAFAEMCARIGVRFIGPPPDVLRRVGDEIGVKRLAERVGVPVAASTRRPGRRAPHRGAGHRRRSRRRLGSGRSGLLRPARRPGGDRGVRLSGTQRRAGA